MIWLIDIYLTIVAKFSSTLESVIQSILCFQKTILKTGEPSTPCSSSWTWPPVSTLNSSKCSSSRLNTLDCGRRLFHSSVRWLIHSRCHSFKNECSFLHQYQCLLEQLFISNNPVKIQNSDCNVFIFKIKLFILNSCFIVMSWNEFVSIMA